MDYSKLKTDLNSGPLATELAPKLSVCNDSAMADIMNRKDRTGYIPRRHISVSLAKFPQVGGLVRWVLNFGTMPAVLGGGVADFGFFCLCQSLDAVDKSDNNLHAGVADITNGLSQVAALVTAGAIPAEFGPYLLGGEVKISRAEELFGIGVSVSANDIAASR